MKANTTKTVPLGGAFWDVGAQVFINKGVNGRWRDLLTAADVGAYQLRVRQELGAECATKWDPACMVEMLGARRLTGTVPCRARWAAATLHTN